MLKTLWLTSVSLSLAISLILFPKEVLAASIRGLSLWWEIVFPSLLPFFVTAELLIGFGVVHGLGALSERWMRPLFNVPGSGGFVWVMGMASGYPSGAKWTADLRRKGQISQVEAERLVSFTNASSPLFIFGAVAVGFFHDPSLGALIAFAHYGGNFLVGIGMRYYKRREDRYAWVRDKTSPSWREAIHRMHHSRLQDGRSLGRLMGDAVTRSVDTLLMVGGFIMLFSVLTELLKQTGLIHLISHLLSWTPLPETFHAPLMAGMLELTTGIGAITATHEPLLSQLILVSFILGFHGFSIQAQIASLLADTDIRFKPYALARIGQAFLSAFLVILGYWLYQNTEWFNQSLPIWNPRETFTEPIMEAFETFGPPFTLVMISTMVLIRVMKDGMVK
ncbi:sporulation integral membrane protein YlbJ [Halobacillus yeomjeoni]|uniref:sporulation integral membrane protein YlbJ n=1 Tax=Halobacillus yeomjeoni TaxID=311194 RepID=UPI001CD1FE21|nr:sporulation integral membrane protein YlbJ [Halobacillus yeomjeoni]MCA0983591.1 sporulation integral membrane protein YlbJ [Halobacillus yeomjeoni]